MSSRVVAIVQARVGSTRLPAKVLLDLAGATALQRCLERVRRFPVDEVIVATSTRGEDDLIVAHARRLGVRTTRGSETDVLSRYLDAARAAEAGVVVRCTADCPLLDPELSAPVISAVVAGRADYASNTLERALPRGLDTEVFTRDALERAAHDATDSDEREHVTMHLYRNPTAFRLESVLPSPKPQLGQHRWTLDTLDDYRMLAALFDALGPEAATARCARVIEVLNANPAISALNAHVAQKPTG